MKDSTKTALLQVFATKIGWAFISMVLLVVFGVFSTNSTLIENGYEWCNYAMIPPALYLLVLTLIMMAYAWIINPIRAYKERKKARESFKDR